jgi:hypothetical protein
VYAFDSNCRQSFAVATVSIPGLSASPGSYRVAVDSPCQGNGV